MRVSRGNCCMDRQIQREVVGVRGGPVSVMGMLFSYD